MEQRSSEMKAVRLIAAGGQDVEFTGRVVGEYTSQNANSTKSRWNELRLWETTGGAWVAEAVRCSSVARESDLRDVAVIDADTDDLEADKVAVMSHFGWRPEAKAFARIMGWDMTRRLS